jgi:hypothetical protein
MHPIAQSWRLTFLRTIRATMDTLHAAHELQVVLTDALEAWLDGENIDPRGYPRKYQAALTAQNLIGWHSFLQGYWSSQWISLQEANLKQTKNYSYKVTGKISSSKLLTVIWEQILQGWTLHNDQIHGTNKKLADADLRKQTISKIFQLHQRRRDVLPDHASYLFLTNVYDTVRTASLQFMRNWIRIDEPSIMESIRTAQSQAIHNTKSLSTYFTPIPCKRPPKPRFARNTRLLGDGRQKTCKRTKPLPNPTRNRITLYFQPRAPQPRPQYTT